jgi:hypothetical protein
MQESRDTYRVLVGKPERKRSLGRPRHEWDNNIKMDLQEEVWWAWIGSIWLKIGAGDGHL